MKRFSIRHHIPGRMRLRVPELRRTARADFKDLADLDGMILVRANPKCACLVLRYDPRALSRNLVLERVAEQFLSARSWLNEQAPCKRQTRCACAERIESVPGAARRFAVLSGAVATLFVRTSLMGAAVSQTLFSPLGLVVLACGLPLARKAVRDVRNKRPGLNTFLAGGLLASLAGGQAATALEILWINTGADLLSAWIAERSRKHISEILEITSHHTFVLVDGVEVEFEVSQVKPGQVVVLHTGEKISVDGIVVRGQALVDEAPINGRQESVHKTEGDGVFAGTFVQEGVIQVRADKVGDATYLARVMHKVQDALENRAPIEGVADRLASRVVRLGFAATGLTLLLTGSLWRAYTVLLVMACPCATVLAASTAVSAAMNTAARNHILIKGGRYLEEIGKAKTLFFDKTGTLTTTQPRLMRTVLAKGVDEDELVRLAASTETHNHHPLALAILAEAAQRDVAPVPHGECDYHMGMGMRAVFGNNEVLVGNAKLAALYRAEPGPLEDEAAALRKRGLTVLYVYKNSELQGLLGFAAQERPKAAEVIRTLRSRGIERVELITGDEEAAARQLARRLGMEAWHSSIMPEAKADIVAQAVRDRGPVLMVGDGINDALALTRADVGVAFGTAGSEVAVEAADIALVKDDLESLAAVHNLSQKTLRVAHENFWIATGSNILGVGLGALGLLTPVTAGLVHVAHSLGILANSSRLLRLPADSPRTPKAGESLGLSDNRQASELSGDRASRSGQDQDSVPAGHRH